MKKQHLFLALILYLFSAGATYGALSMLPNQAQSEDNPVIEPNDHETALSMLLEIDPSEPKDKECPLNGAMFTQTEKESWEKRRPLFIMIENSPDARPQSGLSRADVVFEALAEGGVTRFGAVFYCNAQKQDVIVAPVRSARTYFVDWASGFNFPMYVHVGGANLSGPVNALGQIRQYGWSMQNDIDQFSEGYPTFIRNETRIPGKKVATEHTMESSTEKLWQVASKRNWTNLNPDGEEWSDGYVPFEFEDESKDVNAGSVTSIAYDFWSGYDQYSVSWNYDSQTDTYLRTMGGVKHVDLENNEPISASTVIVLKTVEKGPVDELRHMLYETVGKGKALIFKHGEVIEANWSKKTRTSQIAFSDSRGATVPLARGPIWISVVGLGNEISY